MLILIWITVFDKIQYILSPFHLLINEKTLLNFICEYSRSQRFLFKNVIRDHLWEVSLISSLPWCLGFHYSSFPSTQKQYQKSHLLVTGYNYCSRNTKEHSSWILVYLQTHEPNPNRSKRSYWQAMVSTFVLGKLILGQYHKSHTL